MRKLLIIITGILMIVSMWLALTIGSIQGPSTSPDSPVRNIIYVHVPSSISALLCFIVLAAAGIAYLITSQQKWDRLALASAEVGMVFATIMNVTGSIFSHAEWNTWWTPSSRLVTAAILWFLYVAYLILRSSLPGSQKRRARICAVFSIIAFIDVPMIWISARWIPDIHRPDFSFDASPQRWAFFLGMIATAMLAALLIWIRTDILKINAKLNELYN
jgi:heme exporter protein C